MKVSFTLDVKELSCTAYSQIHPLRPVSMVDPGFLDKIEETARKLRKSSKPFGGIQLVLTGDFFQLPPVTKNNAPTRFAFDAKCWSQVIHEMVNLTQVFRQKDESESNTP